MSPSLPCNLADEVCRPLLGAADSSAQRHCESSRQALRELTLTPTASARGETMAGVALEMQGVALEMQPGLAHSP